MVIPVNVGNMRIIDGTLRASKTFPADNYLIEAGSTKDCSNGQGSCNENFGFENLMLDCSQVCAGGIKIEATMGSVMGPEMFFLGFNVGGVTINGGHEVLQYLYIISPFPPLFVPRRL